jgi:NTE family protein
MKKIGLALGAGGARGLAHIGVLKVLEAEGIKPDFIAGASMGAIIGALYASGMSLTEIEKEAMSLTKRKILSKVFDFANPQKSLIAGKKVHDYIAHLVGGKTFNDTIIPLRIVTTNLGNGEQMILKKGSIARAIKASISVPGIFPPVKIEEHYLIDGGIVNPTPIDVVKRMGADIVIGVDFISKREIKIDNPGIVATLLQSYEIIRTQAVKLRLDKMNHDAIMIKPEIRGMIDSFKFYNIEKFIKSGEEATQKEVERIKRKL